LPSRKFKIIANVKIYYNRDNFMIYNTTINTVNFAINNS